MGGITGSVSSGVRNRAKSKIENGNLNRLVRSWIGEQNSGLFCLCVSNVATDIYIYIYLSMSNDCLLYTSDAADE